MSSPVSPPESPALSDRDVRLAAEVDAAMAQFLERVELAPNLREAAQHAVLGGGKRMRPLLVLHSAGAVGGSVADAMPAAVAIELIHAFSLVHDDLPALDNDLVRRGRPTVHVAFGEAMAVLAGDVLLSLAMESAGESPRESKAILRELARATTAMINGQVLDTLGDTPRHPSSSAASRSGDRSNDRPIDRLHRIHANKTGALLVASCRMGGLAAGGEPRHIDALGRWGQAMGLMFQIVDDILDETQSAEHVGKAVGKDRDAGKLTFPGILGLEASHAEVRRLHTEAASILEPLGERARPLHELADFLATRTR